MLALSKLTGGISINGRTHYFQRIRCVTKTAKGKYAVETTIGPFTVEGGRSLGGSRRDWFLESPEWTKPIDCVSLMDALRCIETM